MTLSLRKQDIENLPSNFYLYIVIKVIQQETIKTEHKKRKDLEASMKSSVLVAQHPL